MTVTRQTKYLVAEVIALVTAMISGAALITSLIDANRNIGIMFIAGMAFTACLIIEIRLWIDPDRVRASQSQSVLNLASETLEAMADGLTERAAQSVCDTLLPATRAIAVAITDTEVILGYSGSDKALNPTDAPIRTAATHGVLETGQMRVMRSAAEIGFPNKRTSINAAIIVPLKVSDEVVGTLKFYYPNPRQINETQKSIAAGFGELLSTQMAAGALEQQKKLATSMELKALQSQINPHFLFNTINTIASFIRTDPDKARVLLREFAAFYRATLEDAEDLILLTREIAQTERYLQFEIARFGEDRLAIESEIPDSLDAVRVPAFMVQPLVENAVKHAMPATGKLTIRVEARTDGPDVIIEIIDDGIGMDQETRDNIMQVESQTGLGIAVRNIKDRILGYYGPESYMKVESTEGQGTTITLLLKDGTSHVEEEAAV